MSPVGDMRKVYFRYVLRKLKKHGLPVVIAFSFLASVFLSIAFILGTPRSAILAYIPAPLKNVGKIVISDLNNLKIRIADVPYFFYSFKNPELAVYDLIIEEDKLAELDNYFYANRYNMDRDKIFKKAKFFANGQEYDVKVSYRGDEDIHFIFPKKSWRIQFSNENLFKGAKAINLIIPGDRSLIAEHFNNYRAEKFGLHVPQSSFPILKVNGRSQGVYFEIEQWGEEFLEKEGLTPDANLYGEEGAGGDIYASVHFWRKYAENPIQSNNDFTELEFLIKVLNHPSDDYFWTHIPQIIDMDNFLSWQVHSLLSGSTHQDFFHNGRLYFDPTVGLFKFFPWDVSLEPLSADMLEKGIDFIDYNPLVQRILKNPDYLLRRNEILWNYVKEDKNLEDDLNFYDKTFKEVRVAFLQDRNKRYSNSAFLRDIEIIRENLRNNFFALREFMNRAEVEILPRLNIPAFKNEIYSLVIGAQVDIEVKSLVPQSLVSLSARGIDENQYIEIYYDTNKNGKLDFQDERVWQGRYSGEPIELDRESLLFSSSLKTEDIPGQDELRNLGRTKVDGIKETIFIFTQGEQLSEISVDLGFDNHITGFRSDFTSKLFVSDSLFWRIEDKLIGINKFIINNPSFLKKDEATIILPSGAHIFSRDIILPIGVKLEIAPGAVVYFADGTSLVSSGGIFAKGTPNSPIIFRGLNSDAWGSVAVIGAQKESVFENTKFIGGQGMYVNGIYSRASLSLFSSPVKVINSHFSGARGDDALNIKNTKAEVTNNIFENNSFDGLDLDFVEGKVQKNRFSNNGNDGIDISGSNVVIENNFIYASGDKGISVGEASRSDIINNLVVDGNTGVAIKDSSFALLINNTIFNNKVGVQVFQKKNIFNGAETRIVNSIIFGNKDHISKDDLSSVKVENSILDNDWGDGGDIVIVSKSDFSSLEDLEKSDFINGGFSGIIIGAFGLEYNSSILIGFHDNFR